MDVGFSPGRWWCRKGKAGVLHLCRGAAAAAEERESWGLQRPKVASTIQVTDQPTSWLTSMLCVHIIQPLDALFAVDKTRAYV